MRLSLLDRSRTRHGQSESAALGHTVERAIEVEQLGYERLWVAEHHAVPGIASGSPAVLLAAIGARTTRIRLGSGGVMLPNHRPLAVAEQFRMLAALHPGRIDLGGGRSLGFTEPVRRALGRLEADAEAFPREGEGLRGRLEGAAARSWTPRSCRTASPPTVGRSARTEAVPRRSSSPWTPWSPTPMPRRGSWRCRRSGRWCVHAPRESSGRSSRWPGSGARR